MKVHIVLGGGAYEDLFLKLGYSVVDNEEEADFLCFTGGEDVTPSLYRHKPHATTYSSLSRDIHESKIFIRSMRQGKPMVGICRGGQFLNVMSGGEMYQDCTMHTRCHDLIDQETGEKIHVTSTHHQMMKPSNNAIIIATAKENGTRTFWNNESWKTEQSVEDYEVVYYPNTASLCFQPHPEMMLNSPKFNPMREYFGSLLDTFLLSELRKTAPTSD